MPESEAIMICWGYAAPVVLYFNGIESIIPETNFHTCGAGVEAVFDELFDNGAEVDDDLT